MLQCIAASSFTAVTEAPRPGSRQQRESLSELTHQTSIATPRILHGCNCLQPGEKRICVQSSIHSSIGPILLACMLAGSNKPLEQYSKCMCNRRHCVHSTHGHVASSFFKACIEAGSACQLQGSTLFTAQCVRLHNVVKN